MRRLLGSDSRTIRSAFSLGKRTAKNLPLLVGLLAVETADLSCAARGDTPDPARNGAVVVLLDISRSLDSLQCAEIDETVQRACEKLPVNMRWLVYLVLVDGKVASGARPVWADTLELGRYFETAWGRRLAMEARKTVLQDLSKRMLAIRAQGGVLMKAGRSPLAGGRPQRQRTDADHTCIIDALAYCGKLFRAAGPTAVRRIIVGSDMIEDCPKTGIDMEVSLDSCLAAMKYLVPEKQQGCLRGCSIEIFRPSCAVGQWPAWMTDDVIEDVWGTILERFGVPADSVMFKPAIAH